MSGWLADQRGAGVDKVDREHKVDRKDKVDMVGLVDEVDKVDNLDIDIVDKD